MRRSLLVVSSLLLAANVVYLAGSDGDTVVAAADDPTLVDAATTTTSTTTTIATTTTVAPTPPPTEPPRPVNRPVRAPSNPYQPEPYRVVGTIEIPKLGLRAPIGEGISLTTIDRGPSHWPGTAMPGELGNVVIAGHRVTHTKPFRNIHLLVPGDELHFYVGDVRTTYRMTGHEVVTPDQTRIVAQTAEPRATLFACHPPGSARYRYVAYFALVQ